MLAKRLWHLSQWTQQLEEQTQELRIEAQKEKRGYYGEP